MTVTEHQPHPQPTLAIKRYFTSGKNDPLEEVDWQIRDARLIDHRDDSVIFEQLGVEVPCSWSVNSTNILAQKYFRGAINTPQREASLRQVVLRLANTITNWGIQDGYFTDTQEADLFKDELVHLLVHQKAAFNSPVWFNIGVDGVPQQASACFILSVEDDMDSILNWYAEEGRIFKGGSGSGVNLSKIRASSERLTGGWTASGPVSFMRGADASAGAIKSGGKTRRAAKMVVLNADHPDIEEFIWCKAKEERKARALEQAGFDMSLNGDEIHSVQYQNANNSVRVSDEFMEAVANDEDWSLSARTDREQVRKVKARDLMKQMAEAAWECADPGIQFDTTINDWHTTPNAGRINASNPCSEYLHLDDSACNLASLNLLKFRDTERTGGFDIEGFREAVKVVFTAQEILVGNADYPTEKIAENTKRFRQLGLGYANLGALLMCAGLPYDSDKGRALAASITALMSGEAYHQSARLAKRMGPFAGYKKDKSRMLEIIDRHRNKVADIDKSLAPPEILKAAQSAWDNAYELGSKHGVRNAQATVLAPTGTIGLLMDCDTTGIEPDLALVKSKRLVGGGVMSIINKSVPVALSALGYSTETAKGIVEYIEAKHVALGAPGLDPTDLPVFACSLGEDAITHQGHIKMMGAVQPFLSGGISKTVNLPQNVTVEDIEDILIQSWHLGIKSVAIYRDNCKVAQPLSSGSTDEAETLEALPSHPKRQRLPKERKGRTFAFSIADCKGFITVGEYEDGRCGEIFIRVSKQGSTLAGIMDAFAISVSYGLQYGVPLSAYVKAFVGMRCEPAGITGDSEIRIANSLMDYIFRRLALTYLTTEERLQLNIFTTDERENALFQEVHASAPLPTSKTTLTSHGKQATPSSTATLDGPLCMLCGVVMRRAGTCFVCSDCGTTSGCS